MNSDVDAGRPWPVDREMFRIGARMLLVDPDGKHPDAAVEPVKEKVATGAG